MRISPLVIFIVLLSVCVIRVDAFGSRDYFLMTENSFFHVFPPGQDSFLDYIKVTHDQAGNRISAIAVYRKVERFNTVSNQPSLSHHDDRLSKEERTIDPALSDGDDRAYLDSIAGMIEIFPIPMESDGSFTIKWDGTIRRLISYFSIQSLFGGLAVSNRLIPEGSEHQLRVSMPDNPKGMYLIECHLVNGKVIKKWTIK